MYRYTVWESRNGSVKISIYKERIFDYKREKIYTFTNGISIQEYAKRYDYYPAKCIYSTFSKSKLIGRYPELLCL